MDFVFLGLTVAICMIGIVMIVAAITAYLMREEE